jgi:hypothetical protein
VFDLEEFDSALDDLEVRLEQLHLLFQRFFSGTEHTQPTALREEIDQQLAALWMSQRNLGALSRVRLTLLHQRYESYQKSWERLAGRASSAAHVRRGAMRESAPVSPIERASRGWSEPALPSELPRSLTPPLGTPSSAPLAAASRVEPNSRTDRTPSVRPDSARTIRDFRAPHGGESARTHQDLRAPVESPSSAREPAKTQPRLPLPFSVDSSTTTPYLRLPSDDELGLEPHAEPAPESTPRTGLAEVRFTPEPAQNTPSRQMNMERVREIHARLRASNTRPPSLERLAKRLSETEAKLKALHGDRTVTFDVVLRDDGKAIVKPIVH